MHLAFAITGVAAASEVNREDPAAAEFREDATCGPADAESQ
jgi:hypothetical protein